MRGLIITSLFLFSHVAFSQVDVFNYEAVTIGGEYKQTKHEGFYVKTNVLAGTTTLVDQTSKFSFVKDQGSALNIDANYFIFEKNNIQIYNIDGLIYLLSYFGNMSSNHSGELYYSFSKYVTTPSDNLSQVNSPVDVSKSSRFWDFNLIDINASFGKKKVTAGFNLDWKIIGITGPFTWFQDKSNQYTYICMQSASKSKILAGPNIAFRQNMKTLAFVCVTGVNFCANRYGDFKNNGDFKINYNPFLKATLFFGKRAGAYLGFKYDLIKASSKLQIADHSSATSTSYFAENKMSVNQFEVKLGIYFKRGK